MDGISFNFHQAHELSYRLQLMQSHCLFTDCQNSFSIYWCCS